MCKGGVLDLLTKFGDVPDVCKGGVLDLLTKFGNVPDVCKGGVLNKKNARAKVAPANQNGTVAL